MSDECKCGRETRTEATVRVICTGCGDETKRCECPRPSDIDHLERAKAALEAGWTQGSMVRVQTPGGTRARNLTWGIGVAAGVFSGSGAYLWYGWPGFFACLVTALAVTAALRFFWPDGDLGFCSMGALAFAAAVGVPFLTFVFGHIPGRLSNLLRISIPEADRVRFRTEWGQFIWDRQVDPALHISRYNEAKGRTHAEILSLFDRAIALARLPVMPPEWFPYSWRSEWRRLGGWGGVLTWWTRWPRLSRGVLRDVATLAWLCFVAPVLEWSRLVSGRVVHSTPSRGATQARTAVLLAGQTRTRHVP
jgi:hypothetical protein